MKVEDELPRLLRALALSQRFHLYVAHGANPRAADRLIQAIQTELPKLRKAPVHVVRLDPYAAKLTDAPLINELIETVLVPLLDAPPELQGHGTIHIVDASRASSSDDDTWAKFFASWNEKRNLLYRHDGEVIVVLPRALALVFATDAPDVWSIRSGEYEITDGTSHVLAWVANNTRTHSLVSTRDFHDILTIEEVEANREDHAQVPIWRLLPPLALFGGDIVIDDWLEDVLRDPTLLQGSAHSPGELDSRVPALRILRDAEHALAEHAFARADQLLDSIALDSGFSPKEQTRSLVARAVALAALDREDEALRHIDLARQISDEVVGYEDHSTLGASAYIAWCRGALRSTDAQAILFGLHHPKYATESQLLRLMERGRMQAARIVVDEVAEQTAARDVAARRKSLVAIGPRFVAIDYRFLFDGLDDARRDLEDIASSTARHGRPFIDRARPFAALCAALAHDIAGARRLLRTSQAAMVILPGSKAGQISARLAWQDSVHRYVAGVIETADGNREAARGELDSALTAMAGWAHVGFERRSIHRAIAATQLAAAAVDPDRARALQRAREAQAIADRLLGETGEDCMARVLAVEARWTIAQCTHDAAQADQLAREALDLAQPLRATGVESWIALADRRIAP